MQVSVESGEGLERRLLVDLPAERVEGEMEKKLAELAQHVKLDGFRPGKVPMRVIKQRFGDQVLNHFRRLCQQLASFFDYANAAFHGGTCNRFQHRSKRPDCEVSVSQPQCPTQHL